MLTCSPSLYFPLNFISYKRRSAAASKWIISLTLFLKRGNAHASQHSSSQVQVCLFRDLSLIRAIVSTVAVIIYTVSADKSS